MTDKNTINKSNDLNPNNNFRFNEINEETIEKNIEKSADNKEKLDDNIFKNIVVNNAELNKNQLFGKLLVYMRKNGYDIEYSILSQVSDINLQDNVLNIGVVGNSMYLKVSQNNIVDYMNSVLAKDNVKVNIINKTEENKSKIDVESFLRKHFEKYLNIVTKKITL